ncbi:hypothetical protein [Candidatus Electrothrix sp.]|uniref:hypothetical protein n=1 Tax=Candidatus Electrothrix sp. TaxID=2170559 RepID=UPI0040571C48
MSVHVVNSIRAELQGEDTAEYLHFVRPVGSQGSDVQVCMTSSFNQYKPVAGDVIFAARYLRIQKVGRGIQVLYYRMDPQPYVTILVDQQFSRFSFCFYCGNEEKSSGKIKKYSVYPYRASADALLLQHSFINHQGMLIHAGGGSVRGKGMVFAGISGAGKSTLTELLSSFPTNRLFSEERLVVRFVGNQWTVWGTPWKGTGNIVRNESAPLSALFFLKQAEKTHVTALTPSQGLHRLLQVASIPWYSAEWTNKGIAVCESLIRDIPMFELAFRPDQTAIQEVEHLAASL